MVIGDSQWCRKSSESHQVPAHCARFHFAAHNTSSSCMLFELRVGRPAPLLNLIRGFKGATNTHQPYRRRRRRWMMGAHFLIRM
jgi:hypothetical protein